MANVQQVLSFKDSQGQLWDSEERARHSNGIHALEAEIRKHAYTDGRVAIQTVLEQLAEWHAVYLEAYNG